MLSLGAVTYCNPTESQSHGTMTLTNKGEESVHRGTMLLTPNTKSPSATNP